MRNRIVIAVLALVVIGAGGFLGRSIGVSMGAAEMPTTTAIALATTTVTDPSTATTTTSAATTTTVVTTTTTTATTTTTTLVPVGEGAADTEWELVFADEFSDNSLGNAWAMCYWWVRDGGCTNESNGNLQWYMPDGVSVHDGTLRLTGRAEVVNAPDRNRYEYVSGMVTTGREHDDGPVGFSFEYGYVEARMRVPSGKGLWSAFWMLPITNESRPEIDVMEILGHVPDTVEMHIHVEDSSGTRVSRGHDWVGPDFSTSWHTYAVDWNADRIVWYVDGNERWRMSDSELVPAEPLYLIANLAIGGDWPGSPNDDTELPAVYEIDYIRVWQETSGE